MCKSCAAAAAAAADDDGDDDGGGACYSNKFKNSVCIGHTGPAANT